MQVINLSLPVPAVQQILNSLAKQPYADVAALIREIEHQGTLQLQAAKEQSGLDDSVAAQQQTTNSAE